jgi:hypothetical protein
MQAGGFGSGASANVHRVGGSIVDPQPNDFIVGEAFADPHQPAPLAGDGEPVDGLPVRASFSQSHSSLADRIRESATRGDLDAPGEPAA